MPACGGQNKVRKSVDNAECWMTFTAKERLAASLPMVRRFPNAMIFGSSLEPHMPSTSQEVSIKSYEVRHPRLHSGVVGKDLGTRQGLTSGPALIHTRDGPGEIGRSRSAMLPRQ